MQLSSKLMYHIPYDLGNVMGVAVVLSIIRWRRTCIQDMSSNDTHHFTVITIMEVVAAA
jgi:hypothetical protein